MPPIQAPVESFAYISARQAEIDVILFIGHRILDGCEPEDNGETRKRTLIKRRSALAVPKTVLAGVMLETSFAGFNSSMATFNLERALSRPSRRRDVEAMAETRGGK